MRVRFDIAYDGRFFHGWAAQPGIRTVQGEIQAALAQVLRREITLTVAGRTDAGVHALGQVAHADLEEKELGDPARLATRLSAVLAMRAASITKDPHGQSDVVINRIQAVSPEFDARFSALSRHYEYRISSGWKNPLERNRTWWVKTRRPLNLMAMKEFSAQLLGEHDFLSFCKPRPGATTIRTLKAFDIIWRGNSQAFELVTTEIGEGGTSVTSQGANQESGLEQDPGQKLNSRLANRNYKVFTGLSTSMEQAMADQSQPTDEPINQELSVHVQADAFCHSMVRSLVGALIQVGQGSKPVEWSKEVLENPSRSHSVPLAPPHGLTLMKVDYPPVEQYGVQAQRSRRVRSQCCE